MSVSMSVQNTLAKALPVNIPERAILWGIPLLGALAVWMLFPLAFKILYLVVAYKIIRAEEKLIRDAITGGYKLPTSLAAIREQLFSAAPGIALPLIGLFLIGFALWWPSANLLHIPLGLWAFTALLG